MPIELSHEILQVKANDLMAGLSEATKNGLDISHLSRLDQLTQQRHEDLLLVCLGMKPMATYFEPFLNIRSLGEPYLEQMLQPGMLVSQSGDAIWNPQLVKEILVENEDLLNKVLAQEPYLEERLTAPSSKEFARFVRMLSNVDCLKEATALEGVMLGYPREACEIFGEYYPLLYRLIGIAVEAVEERGEDSVIADDFTLNQFIENENGLKDELLRVVDTLPRKINPKVIETIQQIRLADVPGSKFITFGEITTEYERVFREAYQSSGIDRDWTK